MGVALGARHLRMMIRQRKSGPIVIEGIATTHNLPINDVERPSLVLGMAADTRFAAECAVQTSLVQHGIVTR
jgi:hypothetical protein